MERVIATHHMRSDSGKDYMVDEIQEYVYAGTKDGGGDDWLEGMKRLELDDGTRLNYIDADTFKIVATGTIIRRV